MTRTGRIHGFGAEAHRLRVPSGTAEGCAALDLWKGTASRVCVATPLSLLRSLLFSHFDPWRAPWALFWRRFAANSGRFTPLLSYASSRDTDSSSRAVSRLQTRAARLEAVPFHKDIGETSPRWKNRVLAITAAILLLSFGALAQNAHEVLGTWEGESKCTVANSPCHDEHVIYEISQAPKSKQFTISMDKVVGGERQNMGSIDCSYEGAHLHCKYNTSDWDFDVADGQMTGTLKLGDGTLYRRIWGKKKP